MPKSISIAAGIVFTLLVGCGAEADGTQESLGESQDALTQTYTYFTCNATGWQLTDSTRLTNGGLDYDVTQAWMVTDRDNCAFVTTNALNGWGTQQTTRGAYVDGPTGTNHNLYVVGSGKVAHVAGTAQFDVKYPALGRYHVQLDSATGAFTVKAAVQTPPDTKITGSSSPFPNMRLYTFTSTQPTGGTFACRCDVGGSPGTWKICASGDINTASCGSPAGWIINVRAINAQGVVDPTPATSF